MINLRITSTSNLINFLKRLKVVDRSVLLELSQKELKSKIHTPDKSVMKFASIDFSEVFEGEVDWDKLIGKKSKDHRVKIGLIEVNKAIDCFKHFSPEEDVYLEIETDFLDSSCVATQIKLISSSLYINLKCADLSLLSYVEDNIFDMVHSKEDYLAKFKVYQSDFSCIVSLCGLETNSEELLNFNVSAKSVEAKGDSFNYKIKIGADNIEAASGNCSAPIYKNQLSYMESETCDCFLHENRIVFFSEQSNTSIAIGVVIK
jgi:hypothetical protein